MSAARGVRLREIGRRAIDVPPEVRKAAEREIRALVYPMLLKTLGGTGARKATDIVTPVLVDLAAQIAHGFLRSHQLGDKFAGWVSMSAIEGDVVERSPTK